MLRNDFTGKILGTLHVIKRIEDKQIASGKKYVQWLCECDKCGNKIIKKSVDLHRNPPCCPVCAKRKHEETLIKQEKLKQSKLFHSYCSMKSRCLNSSHEHYPLYGGRGITICDEWLHSFENFKKWAYENDYQDGLTIDRIDVNGNYEPSNCRWITQREQCLNRRNTRNLTIDGVTKPLVSWCEELNVPQELVRNRMRLGWPNDRLFDPIAEKKTIEYCGQIKTYEEWASELGMTYKNFWKRLVHRGWDLDRVFNQPVRRSPAKHDN